MAKTYQITSKSLTRQATAVMRDELPIEQVGRWLASCYSTVHEYLRRAEVAVTGPPFARFTFIGDEIAVEAGFPVEREIDGDGRVEPSALPGGRVAVTTHLGRYEELEDAYAAVRNWIIEHGYATAGPHWEFYFTDPAADPDPSHWRTDVVTPYKAA
jgi:effector-binding domain-containing protein